MFFRHICCHFSRLCERSHWSVDAICVELTCAIVLPTLQATPEIQLHTADEFLRSAELQFHATTLGRGMPVGTASALKSIRDMAGRDPKKRCTFSTDCLWSQTPLGHHTNCTADTTFPKLNCCFSVPRCVISEPGTRETSNSARVVQSARCTERLEGGRDLDILRGTVR